MDMASATTMPHIHVPTPGELYSPTVGSAIVTVIRELAKAHGTAGGHTSVVVARNREHDAGGVTVLPYEADSREWLTKHEKIVDAGTAGLGLGRRNAERRHRTVIEAIPGHFNGPVFLHNAPHLVRVLRRLRPRAHPVLYVHNDLWRTWTVRERLALARDCRLIVFVSQFMADRFLSPERMPASSFLVAVNGVDTTAFAPRPREADIRPVVLFVGKVTPHKGAHLLVEAAIRLWREGLDFELRIVGRAELAAGAALTPYEQELRSATNRFQDRVHFLGFVEPPQLPKVLQAADILCVPSDWNEPCSLTLPEGLAAGLACVATRRGGLPEVGGDAVLWAEASAASLTDALRRVLQDDALRRDLGRRALARAASLTWKSRLDLINDKLAIMQAERCAG